MVANDTYLVKTENEVLNRMDPQLYKEIVDAIYSPRNKFEQDISFEILTDFFPNTELTLKNPKIVLRHKNRFELYRCINKQVYEKENKVAGSLICKIPKGYKQNTISKDLHRS